MNLKRVSQNGRRVLRHSPRSVRILTYVLATALACLLTASVLLSAMPSFALFYASDSTGTNKMTLGLIPIKINYLAFSDIIFPLDRTRRIEITNAVNFPQYSPDNPTQINTDKNPIPLQAPPFFATAITSTQRAIHFFSHWTVTSSAGSTLSGTFAGGDPALAVNEFLINPASHSANTFAAHEVTFTAQYYGMEIFIGDMGHSSVIVLYPDDISFSTNTITGSGGSGGFNPSTDKTVHAVSSYTMDWYRVHQNRTSVTLANPPPGYHWQFEKDYYYQATGCTTTFDGSVLTFNPRLGPDEGLIVVRLVPDDPAPGSRGFGAGGFNTPSANSDMPEELEAFLKLLLELLTNRPEEDQDLVTEQDDLDPDSGADPPVDEEDDAPPEMEPPDPPPDDDPTPDPTEAPPPSEEPT